MAEKIFNILLAEDDFNLGILLVDFLENEGFIITLCRDGALALNAFETQMFDLCLLDIMMPKMDGFTLAQKIRQKNKRVPIIFITAKSQKEDKLAGYAMEADDYITKPFDEEELVCKIKAIFRRTLEQPTNKDNDVILIGVYKFDYKNQSLSIGTKTKRITEKENQILQYLCKHQNTIIRREKMLMDLWGVNDYFLGRSLDVFITKMRKYLKDDPTLSIENVFGVGFVFNVPKK